jgi:rhodanese-related sulfurtransferase
LPLPDEVYTQEELFRQKIIPVAPDRSVSLIQATASLSRATVIVTYCNSHCALSKNLMLRLKTIGFTNVRYLAGGIDSWREKGYPLEVQNP